MAVDDIFSRLIAHIVEGLMTHAQLSDYYDFLGLCGYKECHKYHYFAENKSYRDLSAYCIEHYNKIPKEIPIDNPNVIPESWYQYLRQDVNPATRMNSIQIGMDKWVDWEKKTKLLYEQLYIEAINLNDIALSIRIKDLIKDVDKELAEACQKRLEMKAVDFNISDLMQDQRSLYKKYKKKLEERSL